MKRLVVSGVTNHNRLDSFTEVHIHICFMVKNGNQSLVNLVISTKALDRTFNEILADRNLVSNVGTSLNSNLKSVMKAASVED
jgi:hypothetical protein